MRQGKGQGSPGGVTDATQAAGSCLGGWFGLAAGGGLAGLLALYLLWGPELRLLWGPPRNATFPGTPTGSLGHRGQRHLLPGGTC